MNNKYKTRAKALFEEWKQQNPQFFKGQYINKDLYKDAIQSLVSFLRVKRLSLADCNIELNKDSVRSTYLSIYVPTVISWLFGLIGCWLQGEARWICIAAFIIFFLWMVFAFVKDLIAIATNHISDNGFLRVAIQEYIFLYDDNLKNNNKLVELLDGKLATIPANAETVYSEQMHLSKYYQNAFVVAVNSNGQKFDYVIYSNSVNCSIDNFVKLCKDQIGKNWDTDKYQIDIIKAPVVSGV